MCGCSTCNTGKEFHLCRDLVNDSGVFMMIEPLWGHHLFDESLAHGLRFHIYHVENKTVSWHSISNDGKSHPKTRFNLGSFKRGCKN